MPRASYVDSDTADTWARTIEQIPTTIGKLSYSASLKSKDSAAYSHPGLARISSAEQADRVLRASHEVVFGEWLNLSLEQQYNDLRVFLLSEGIDDAERKAFVSVAIERYIPATARPAERLLYRTDLDTIIDLLRQDEIL
jgi:hypothetical protein